MVLGHEVISWLKENKELHCEKNYLRDEFKKIFKLMKSFFTPSIGFSHNFQTFFVQYVSLLEKVVELEKVSSSVGMVSEEELNGVRDDLTAL